MAQGEKIMSAISNPISRRNMLTAAAGVSVLSATTLAQAQSADSMPETRRPGHGGSNPGPKNPVRASQNPDLLSPPASDHGTLPNLRFSFDDSHVRLESGGWTRQVTVRELGISKNIAGVNMRLKCRRCARVALA
jgi:oxalate decarboxylase